MKIKLTADQISVVKESLRYSIDKIRNYSHEDYATKQLSIKPLEDVMAILHDLRAVKESK